MRKKVALATEWRGHSLHLAAVSTAAHTKLSIDCVVASSRPEDAPLRLQTRRSLRRSTSTVSTATASADGPMGQPRLKISARTHSSSGESSAEAGQPQGYERHVRDAIAAEAAAAKVLGQVWQSPLAEVFTARKVIVCIFYSPEG